MTGSVVFNTIGDSEFSVWLLDQSGKEGQSFTSAAGSTTITDVQLSLLDGSASTDGGHITVELWSSSGNAPASELAVLGTIADSSLTSSLSIIDLTVGGAPTLSAGTRYWMVLTSTANSSAEWGEASSATGTGASTEYNSINGTSHADTANPPFLMSVTTDTACFAAGTRILTAGGEVAVESLREGDRVVTARDGGRLAPLRWVGHRRVDLRHHPRPHDINPVRVTAGAFGAGLPHRDLILSPDHAVFVDGHLLTIRHLINGASIVQEAADSVTYYHVELDSHDVLLAEGLPAESFLDTGNRAAFDNGGAPMLAHPDFAPAGAPAEACAPTLPEGAARVALRQRLLDRAGALGHTTTEDACLRLHVAGRAIMPCAVGAAWRFALPAGSVLVQLLSRSAVPKHMRASEDDARRLGVGVTALALDGVAVALDDRRLGAGWHAPEPTLRWTDGAAWLETGGARTLDLSLHRSLIYWAEVSATTQRRAA